MDTPALEIESKCKRMQNNGWQKWCLSFCTQLKNVAWRRVGLKAYEGSDS